MAFVVRLVVETEEEYGWCLPPNQQYCCDEEKDVDDEDVGVLVRTIYENYARGLQERYQYQQQWSQRPRSLFGWLMSWFEPTVPIQAPSSTPSPVGAFLPLLETLSSSSSSVVDNSRLPPVVRSFTRFHYASWARVVSCGNCPRRSRVVVSRGSSSSNSSSIQCVSEEQGIVRVVSLPSGRTTCVVTPPPHSSSTNSNSDDDDTVTDLAMLGREWLFIARVGGLVQAVALPSECWEEPSNQQVRRIPALGGVQVQHEVLCLDTVVVRSSTNDHLVLATAGCPWETPLNNSDDNEHHHHHHHQHNNNNNNSNYVVTFWNIVLDEEQPTVIKMFCLSETELVSTAPPVSMFLDLDKSPPPLLTLSAPLLQIQFSPNDDDDDDQVYLALLDYYGGVSVMNCSDLFRDRVDDDDDRYDNDDHDVILSLPRSRDDPVVQIEWLHNNDNNSDRSTTTTNTIATVTRRGRIRWTDVVKDINGNDTTLRDVFCHDPLSSSNSHDRVYLIPSRPDRYVRWWYTAKEQNDHNTNPPNSSSFHVGLVSRVTDDDPPSLVQHLLNVGRPTQAWELATQYQTFGSLVDRCRLAIWEEAVSVSATTSAAATTNTMETWTDLVQRHLRPLPSMHDETALQSHTNDLSLRSTLV